MARRYTEEQHAFFKKYIPGHPYEKVAQQFNKHWPEAPITTQQAYAYGNNHHIRNGLHYTKGSTRFSPEQQAWLRKYIPGHHHEETARRFNQKWPETPFTAKTSKAYANNHGIKTGFDGRYKPGHRPAHAFEKGSTVGSAHWYQKGHRPENHLKVGSIRKRRSHGHILTFIKTAEPNEWQLYGRWLWEQHHGTIPEGYFIAVRDGDPENLVIENLRMLPLEAMGTLAKHADLKGEARDVILSLGELRATINKKRRQKEDGNQQYGGEGDPAPANRRGARRKKEGTPPVGS